MNSPFRSLLFALLVILSGCDASTGGGSATPPLAGARIGGPFTLTDQDGKSVSDRDFDGRYRLIYFGYSFCPDVCPADLQKLMAGYRALERSDPAVAARIQPIFITVDPARDTPPKLKAFVSAFHPRLIGLTGTDAQIAAVAKEYAIVYQRAGASGATDYLVDHSRQATLFGPKGEPIALVSQDATPDVIAGELKQWAR